MSKITGENKTFEEIIAEEKGTVTHNEEEGKYKVILDGYEFTVDDTTYEVEVTEKGQTTPEKPVEITKYTVTLSKGTGIETVTETQQVEKGKSITISATLSTGYEFVKWNVTSGNEIDVENLTSTTTKVIVNGNMEIQATANELIVLNNINGSENAKVGSGDYAYTNPVIPVGFKTVETTGASWEDLDNDGIVDGWNEGLVIEDNDGNQFVWVPVDGANVTYRYYYNIGSMEENGSYEQSLPNGITNEQAQIDTYHGFYIARYEAGKEGEIPVSKKNQIPWNYIYWSQAFYKAEGMKTFADSNNHVQSLLITDKMWDATMQWIARAGTNVTTGYNSWGNYHDAPVTGITEYSTDNGATWIKTNSTTKGRNTYWLLKTGNSEYTKRKNIYDLAGNLSEWTNAFFYYDNSVHFHRGGMLNGADKNQYPVWRQHSSSADMYTRIQSCFVRSVKFCEHVSASKIS